jgi:hypothetical protein
MSLAALQLAMRAALHAAEPEAFLTMLSARSANALGIYTNMYWARQVDSLAQDFPVTERLLGRTLFERVAATHVSAHPSTSPSIAWLGRDLDQTLITLGRDAQAQVARFEWLRQEAFFTPNAAPIAFHVLGELGPELANAVLGLHPSLRVAELAMGARANVEAAPDALPIAIDLASHEVVAVWRDGDAVVHRVLLDNESRALQSAIAGATVATICEAFVNEEAPDVAAITTLSAWLTRGWIVACAL